MSPMAARRIGVGLAVVNRLLYVVGGYDGESRLSTVECYHPENNEWRLVAPMNVTRSGAGETPVQLPRIIVPHRSMAHMRPTATHGRQQRPFNGLFSRTTWVRWYQEGKPVWICLDLYEARDDVVWGCSGISWTIRKQSAPRSRQIATQTPHQSIFTGHIPFLTPNQQCQSTEGSLLQTEWHGISVYVCSVCHNGEP